MPERRPVLIDGTWEFPGEPIAVVNPYDGAVVAEVPSCAAADVGRAVGAARRVLAAGWPQHERAALLDRVAERAADPEVSERLARTISVEAAKPIKTARAEAERCISTLRFSAVECRKLVGEMVPMQASAAGAAKLGFALAMPIGVVAAISPFNFPLNLVAHKLGPAIAAGCPVVLKPATSTPLSALELVALLHEAGMPPGFVSVVTGRGGSVGDPLVDHPDVSYITFTGSAEVGWSIKQRAVKKKVALELGSNSPLIVCDDGDWETAATRAAMAAFSHAGQSCISTQRVYVHDAIADAFTSVLLDRVGKLVVGDPADPATDVSQLITTGERDRVLSWVEEAVASGAAVLAGGSVGSDGVLAPTVLGDVRAEMKVQCEEVFGPVVTLTRFTDLDALFDIVNDSHLGLQAGIFTRDVSTALGAARRLDYGGVMVNDVPTYRADQQPYGGVRDSGNTREGPAYAVREMTELRVVTIEA